MPRMHLESRKTIGCDDLEFEALACAVLSRGSTLRFRARGLSMHPFVRDGEFLHVRWLPTDQLRVGDLVLCNPGEARLVVHRAVKRLKIRGCPAFVIKGDNLKQPDGIVPADRILGKVIARERSGISADLTGWRWRFANALIVRFSPLRCQVQPIVHRIRSSLALSLRKGMKRNELE